MDRNGKRQSSDACVIGGGQYTPEVVARFYFSERIGGPWSNIVRENNPIVDEHIRAAYLATDEKVAIKIGKRLYGMEKKEEVY